MENDERFMKQALRLARRGIGRTSPNPLVGAVIVRGERVIGQGYHHYFGGPHAEVNAIRNAREDIAGATLYVTLEPCRHYGKTPPCTDAIIREKPGRVVIGMLDPFPEMLGRSVEVLKEHGIETRVGVLEGECRSLNESYIKYTTTGLPFITVKFAETLDGRIAAATGSSRWISSAASRRLAHRLRATHDAVLVGAGTVRADNPELTVRLARGRNPVRVVMDSRLSIPMDAAVLSDQEKARTFIAVTGAAGEERIAALREKGVEVLMLPADEEGRVDLPALLKELGRRQVASVLVEGGAATITSFLRLGLADRLVAIVAPKLMGKGIEAVGELGIRDVDKAIRLTFTRTYRRGEDIVVEARVG
ncbi:MAG TPA: bifunctional diaminohydroxyphosphoribosylaminopyrimidine deaminase/5-amino-6-(5-phosphoribosylamino)uracil reductase RibD [Dehalococcoidales bacterium]|nr:bifunctional diaminohydroxyphosphoribosylaminopyrimidine deaminase/5-amino-6-(5-phosphoribosylamino)uracil reductase RibD [Dehalococcoidales bacterium]